MGQLILQLSCDVNVNLGANAAFLTCFRCNVMRIRKVNGEKHITPTSIPVRLGFKK